MVTGAVQKPVRAVRSYLLAYSAALLVPVVAFASVLLWRFAEIEGARVSQEARVAAQRLMAAVDLELSRKQVAAEALATFPTLRAGDFEAFHRQALDALRVWSPNDPNKLAVVVRDAASQQLANTRIAWGEPLPKGSNPDIDKEIIQSKRPVIQGIFVGATSGRPITSIRVPVIAAGEVTHVLSMAIEPDRFLDVIRSEKLPADWIGTIVDRDDRVIARSMDHDRFVGRPASEDFRIGAKGDSGTWTGLRLTGERVLWAYERSALSGWRAFVGVPASAVAAPVRTSLLFIAALGLIALCLSIALAAPFGNRIAKPVRALEDRARSLGRGEPVQPLATRLREVRAVSEVLAAASVERNEREAALRATEGRLRATHANSAVGIIEVDKNGRFLYVNEPHANLTGHKREELLGRHFAHATHHSDLDRDLDLFQRQVAGEFDIYTIEKQHVRVDGSTGWARVSSTAVRDPGGAFLYAIRVVEDITERKDAEHRQRLLVNELNHRVKNTLATVQALAFQTFRQGATPEVARERFEARLFSLARTHNLLNESHWEGAPVRDVVLVELRPYISENGSRVAVAGPDVDLPPRTAVVLGMVFHELATNAAKYGALSLGSGTVEVTWLLQREGAAKKLRLRWVERDGPMVVKPERTGFGSRLIEAATAGELNGRVTMNYLTTGLVCELEIPLEAADKLGRVEEAAE